MSIEIYSGVPTEELDDGRPWPDGWIKKIFKRPGAASANNTAKKNSDSFWYTPIKKYKLRSMKETKRFIKTLEEVCNGDEDLTIDTMKKQKMIRSSSSQTSRNKIVEDTIQKGGGTKRSRTKQQQQQQPVSILASQKTSSKKKRQSTNNKKKIRDDEDESSSLESIDSIEEENQLYATNEIKRLFKQALEDYQTLYMQGIRKGTCYPNVDLVDPNNDSRSLRETIRFVKGGAIQLLNLLQINLCDGPLCFGKSDYEKRLGMFFFRHRDDTDTTTDSISNTKIKSKQPPSTFDTDNNDDDNGSSSSSDDDDSSSSSDDDDDDDDYNVDVISESRMICCRCVAKNFEIRERVCCSGEWTADQAEQILFNIPKLCQQLECNSQYYELYHRGEPWMNSVNSTTSRDGDDYDGIDLYSPWTVTMTALTMSSIWNLHYVLLGNIDEYNDNTYGGEDEDDDDDGLIMDDDQPTPTRRKQQQQQQQSSTSNKRSKHVCRKCREPSCRRPFRRGGPCGS